MGHDPGLIENERTLPPGTPWYLDGKTSPEVSRGVTLQSYQHVLQSLNHASFRD
jgi:hypothetical protein